MCIKYSISADTLAHPFRYDVHETLGFSFLSRERRVSRVAAMSAFCVATAIARNLGDCERLTLLPLPSLMYCWLCLGLWTTQKPTKRVTWEKLSFSPVYFSSPLSISFSNVSHPEAIYLICFLMRQTKEIKNSSFSQATATREFYLWKKDFAWVKIYRCVGYLDTQ